MLAAVRLYNSFSNVFVMPMYWANSSAASLLPVVVFRVVIFVLSNIKVVFPSCERPRIDWSEINPLKCVFTYSLIFRLCLLLLVVGPVNGIILSVILGFGYILDIVRRVYVLFTRDGHDSLISKLKTFEFAKLVFVAVFSVIYMFIVSYVNIVNAPSLLLVAFCIECLLYVIKNDKSSPFINKMFAAKDALTDPIISMGGGLDDAVAHCLMEKIPSSIINGNYTMQSCQNVRDAVSRMSGVIERAFIQEAEDSIDTCMKVWDLLVSEEGHLQAVVDLAHIIFIPSITNRIKCLSVPGHRNMLNQYKDTLTSYRQRIQAIVDESGEIVRNFDDAVERAGSDMSDDVLKAIHEDIECRLAAINQMYIDLIKIRNNIACVINTLVESANRVYLFVRIMCLLHFFDNFISIE